MLLTTVWHLSNQVRIQMQKWRLFLFNVNIVITRRVSLFVQHKPVSNGKMELLQLIQINALVVNIV